MKVTLFSILVVIVLTFACVLNSFAQDYTRSNLPEGAIARFGKGEIMDIAYSPDGNQFAVSSSVGVWIYDANTGSELSLLTGNTEVIQSVRYSPDGRTIAGFSYAMVDVWDTATGHHKAILGAFGGTGLAYSPDSRTLAVAMDTWENAGRAVKVNLYDVDTGKIKITLTKEPGYSGSGANSLTYSPDGRTIAVAIGAWHNEKWDVKVNVYDVNTGQTKVTLTGFEHRVTGLAYSPDGRTLATANGWSRTVQLWDVVTGRAKATLEGYAGYVIFLAYSPDGRTVAGADTHEVKVWDAVTGRAKTTFGGNGYISTFTYSPDGGTIAVGSKNGSIQLWDSTTGHSKSTLVDGHESFDEVAYSADGQFLTAGSSDGTAHLWDAVSGNLLKTFTGHRMRVASVAFSPDGRLFATGSSDNTVRLWDVVSGNLLKTLTGHHGEVWSVTFSPDGMTIAAGGCPNDTISLWDVATGQRRRSLTGHTTGFRSVVFSPDGKTVAGAGGYGIDEEHICIWDVATGQHRKALIGNMSNYYSLAFSPDGKIFANYGHGGIQLWDTATWTLFQTIKSSFVSSLAFNSDGSVLVSGGRGSVQLWDIATGQERYTFSGVGNVSSVVFSPDDSTIASVIQGVLFLWQVTPVSLPTPQDTDTQPTTQQRTGIQKYERELVQLVYFRPKDRLPQQSIDTQLDTLIRDTQYFYTEQMQDHGGKTFAFETDAGGNTRVHHITGKFDDAYYHENTYYKVVEEVSRQFDTSIHTYLIAIDISTEFINGAGTCGIGGGGWTSRDNEAWLRNFGGTAVIPASGVCFSPRIAAHELGHVFGLDHDFRDDAYLMAYGSQKRLSRCAAEWLDVHRFFNNDPTFSNTDATLEMHTSRASGANTRQLQFELMDPDGLHQAQLLIPTTATDPAPGTKLHSYQSLNGTSQNVEFTLTGLTAAPDTQVTLQVIDVRGNITKEQFSVVDSVSNRSPVGIGTIPFQTLTVGRGSTDLNVSRYFSDPDADTLSYSVKSTNTSVVSVDILGTQLTITPIGTGSAVVTVTASDGKSRVLQSFSVKVNSPPIEEDTTEVSSSLGTVRPEDLVLYLPFDNETGTTATDTSKRQNHATLHNATWTQGKHGNAVQLTGEPGSWVEVPDAPSLDITDEITLMAWIHPTQFTNEWLRIIVKTWAGDTAPWMVYGLYQQGGSNGKTGFIISVDGGQEARCGNGPSPQLPLNTWTHLAATYDGSHMKLYYNGELKVQTSATGQIDTNDVPLSIGRNSEGEREHYIGLIDEVAIWDAALDVSEIRRAMGTPTLETVATTTQVSSDFDDAFTGTALQNLNWQWQNEPSHWDVGETRENFLHIESEPNRNLWTSDATHFLYQETNADTFDVETHFFAKWDTSSGVNGLVVKSPASNNWVTLKFWSQGPGARGRIQYQTRGSENGNGLTGHAGFTPTYGNTELFFRLRKQGDTYTGWYKTTEAEPWIEIGTTHFTLTPPLQLGIYAGVAARAGTLTVDYEYFRSTVDSAVQASPTLSAAAIIVPTQTGLLPNYPNPFNPETWIPYQLSKPANIVMYIYGVDGRLVRTLMLGYQAAGMYRGRSRAAYWDGRNEIGEPVASGVYFYTLTAGDFSATRKMLIRK